MGVQEGYGTIFFGIYHSKLYIGIYGVDMLEELVAMFCLLVTKVSSTYLSQSLGGLGAELITLDSTSFMTSLAIGG